MGKDGDGDGLSGSRHPLDVFFERHLINVVVPPEPQTAWVEQSNRSVSQGQFTPTPITH